MSKHDAAFVAGACAFLAGVAVIYWPLALIVGGGFLAASAWLSEDGLTK